MSTSKAVDLPARLEGVRRRFERWRSKHPPRSRIPKGLWTAAVKAAEVYGVYRTAKALRLDYYTLKERAEAAQPSQDGPRTMFLELPPAVPGSGCECVLEREEVDGTRRLVHLKGIPAPDLTALSRDFWDLRP